MKFGPRDALRTTLTAGIHAIVRISRKTKAESRHENRLCGRIQRLFRCHIRSVVPLPERSCVAVRFFRVAQAMKEAIPSPVPGRNPRQVPVPEPRGIEGTTTRHSLRRGSI